MIAAWMLYSMLVAALILVATRSVERLAEALKRPTRWLWILALAASIIVPVIKASLEVDAATNIAGAQVVGDASSGLAVGWRWDVTDVRFDAPLVVAWMVLSTLLVLRHVRVVQRVRDVRRSSRGTEVNGQMIRVSAEFGPATVGIRQPMIVVPEWVLRLDADSRQLIIAHETEHVRRGDVRLLAAATAATILMPWNPFVWWQCRRLHTAIEIDCDRRVMRASPQSVRQYGELLLEVAAHKSLVVSSGATSLATPGLALERRIDALAGGQGPHASRVAMLTGAAMGAVVAICTMPRPVKLTDVAPPVSVSADTAQRMFSLPTPPAGEFRLLGPASIEGR